MTTNLFLDVVFIFSFTFHPFNLVFLINCFLLVHFLLLPEPIKNVLTNYYTAPIASSFEKNLNVAPFHNSCFYFKLANSWIIRRHFGFRNV